MWGLGASGIWRFRDSEVWGVRRGLGDFGIW